MLRPVLTSILLGSAALAACGSSSGATCPDTPPEASECPVCPPAPRPGGPIIQIPIEALPTDRERRQSLVGFSQDGTTALLRVEDEAVGDFFVTVDLRVAPVPKVIKTWLFQESLTEPIALKQALRGIKPQAAGPASQKNAAGISLLATDDGERVLVMAMKGERTVPIATLPRLRDEDGAFADVSVVKLAWDPTGTRALVIHAQRLAATPGFESQWVHVLHVDPASLPF